MTFICCVFCLDHWNQFEQYTDLDTDSDVMKDVWHGLAMIRLSNENEFFSNNNRIALSLSTDGVPLFKSSSLSMWPVYISVLNLHPSIRMKADNIILAGVWVGPHKPSMKLLLQPVMDDLNSLCRDGLTVMLPNGSEDFKAKLVFAVFDLPAKASVLNCKQFNGKYGCSVCYHPGFHLSNGTRIYPPFVYPECTHAEVLHAAEKATSEHSAVKGIMGTSPIAMILDVVNAVPIDYMHSCLEGVMKLLMKYWFNSSFHGKPFYLGRYISEIDSEFLKQHPPSEFSRPPRSISKHLSYWKASELRNWLLFYSLPLLLGHLPPLYFHHYALFVSAMHILLSATITTNQIDAAQQMLVDFCSFLPELYDEKISTHNVHLLTHLTKYVKLWGPLWTHSVFGHENKNGCLKKLFHGKNQIHQQLLFSIDVCVSLQLLHPILNNHEDVATMDFINRVSNRTYRSNMTSINSHTYIVGPCKASVLTSKQSQAFHCNDHDVFDTFLKLYKDGVMYRTMSSSRDNSLRNDSVCIFKSEDNCTEFGLIDLFIARPDPTALVYKMNRLDDSILKKAGHPCREPLLEYQEVNLLGNYIITVAYQNRSLNAIKIDSIIGKAVVVVVEGTTFAIVQPNGFECH